MCAHFGFVTKQCADTFLNQCRILTSNLMVTMLVGCNELGKVMNFWCREENEGRPPLHPRQSASNSYFAKVMNGGVGK